MAHREWDPVDPTLKKTNHHGYFINESGAIVNADELAWMQYKSEREKMRTIIKLINDVERLNRRVQELEEKIR